VTAAGSTRGPRPPRRRRTPFSPPLHSAGGLRHIARPRRCPPENPRPKRSKVRRPPPPRSALSAASISCRGGKDERQNTSNRPLGIEPSSSRKRQPPSTPAAPARHRFAARANVVMRVNRHRLQQQQSRSDPVSTAIDSSSPCEGTRTERQQIKPFQGSVASGS
jgi:hypothetical protein